MEPVWTWAENWFDNPPSTRVNTTVLSCDNRVTSIDSRCSWWGYSSAGGSLSLRVFVDPPVDSALGPANIRAILRDTVTPAWNGITGAKQPKFSRCSADPTGCDKVVVVRMADPTIETDMVGAAARTGVVTAVQATPTVRTFVLMRLNKTVSWDQPCSSQPCTPPAGVMETRIALSHEWGHVYGLGHCDLARSVMCNVLGNSSNAMANGVGYWTPQYRDAWAIRAFYP